MKAYWHIHHDKLLEFATESIRNRIKYIKKNKPENEIELRLKLMKPVIGTLPDKVRKAWKKGWKVWEKVYNDNIDVITKLHDEECPFCPWDGKTIFPKNGGTIL